MKRFAIVVAVALSCAGAMASDDADKKDVRKSRHFVPDEVRTDGTVTVGGARIDYQAIAGTLVVHAKGYDDALPPDDSDTRDKGDDDAKGPTAEASMFFVAYVRKDVEPEKRPVMFVFNGGPGSATIWLHMGAFGPQRVMIPDAAHGPAAPYRMGNNEFSPMDAADLVFIDAPGAGFSRIAGHDKEKAFYGVDEDAHAFAAFIEAFLSKYGRWQSPKYLFGESYGTTRAAVLVDQLQSDRGIDFNGVILLSEVLNYGLSADGADGNPGIDLPYELALPTYAATAWYHKKLDPARDDLAALIAETEAFALGDYARALAAGSALDPARRDAIVAKLHDYTGLPEAYLRRANLRVTGGEFSQTLQLDRGLTTGRLDTRFSGPVIDPLDKEADYDPQDAAISSAYVSGFNDYARRVLKYGEGRVYKPSAEIHDWNFKHQAPGDDGPREQAANVMTDLAHAMKTNPALNVQLNSGYFDLATPFFAGLYEMRHLPMPDALQANIEYREYRSGHMVYANGQALRQLHDNVVDFVNRTDNLR